MIVTKIKNKKSASIQNKLSQQRCREIGTTDIYKARAGDRLLGVQNVNDP